MTRFVVSILANVRAGASCACHRPRESRIAVWRLARLAVVALAAIAVTALAPSAARAVNQNDPSFVGAWLFDEGAGTTVADVRNGNTGFVNGPFSWTSGILGNAIVASGGGSIDVPDSPSIASISTGLTVAAWVRIDADSDTGIRKQGAFLLEDQSATEPVPNAFSFRIWTDQGLSPGFYGTTQLLLGQWYHVAGTYDGSRMELYVNGVPESAFGVFSDTGAPWTPLWSGVIQPGTPPLQLKYGPEAFVGAIDEVMIFNRALSADEIAEIAAGWHSLPVPEPGASSLVTVAVGVLALGAVRGIFRRRRRSKFAAGPAV